MALIRVPPQLPDPRTQMLQPDPNTPVMGQDWYRYFIAERAALLAMLQDHEDRIASIEASFIDTVFMADHGLVGDYLISGSINPSYTNNTPAWNALMAAYPDGNVTFVAPPGYLGFDSRPNPLPSPFVRLVGAGSSSALCQLYAPGSATEIFLRIGIQSCTVENFEFFCVSSGSGVAIGRVATSGADAPQRTILRNLVFSTFSANVWYGGVWLSGMLGAPHFGTRRHILSDLLVQSTSGWGIRLGAANLVNGTGIYVAGGTSLYIEGDATPDPTAGPSFGTPLNPTNLVNLNGSLGNCQLTASNNCSFYSTVFVDISTDANSASNTFFGGTINSSSLLGTNNHAYINGTII